MNRVERACRSQAKRLAALGIVAGIYWSVAPTALTRADRDTLAARYRFDPHPLRAPSADGTRTVRAVHPDYRRIESWISSVGAAVALGDFDGDGIDNDACLVDTRANDAVVVPVSGTGDRYAPIVLAPPPSIERAETIAPMGCLFADLDEDAKLDVLVYYWGRVPVAFLRRGAGVIAFDLLPQERWFSNAGLLADVDGDGHLDIVIGNYFPDGARVLDAEATTAAAMQDSMSRAYNGGKVHFLLWKRAHADRVEVADADPHLTPNVLHGWTLAIGARDLDGDLLPELYLARDFGPDRLLRNVSKPGQLRFEIVEGSRRFTTPRSKVLGRDSFKGMGVDFGDIDRDGDDDFAVSNIAAPWSLLESNFLFVNESGDFIDRSEPLGTSRGGWAWDVRFADFNNDGWLEIVQANGFVKGTTNRWPELQELATANDGLLAHPEAWPRFGPGDDLSGHQRNKFFARAGSGVFTDISSELGLAAADVSRGLAVADIDADGDMDLAVANQWEDSELLVNTAPGLGRSLVLRLSLLGHPAVGATATITLPGRHRISQQVDGGTGHSGKSAPMIHFGLGAVSAATELPVQIRYRDRDGTIRSRDVMLRPGTHTIELAKGAP